jgi:hypothetical protein
MGQEEPRADRKKLENLYLTGEDTKSLQTSLSEI